MDEEMRRLERRALSGETEALEELKWWWLRGHETVIDVDSKKVFRCECCGMTGVYKYMDKTGLMYRWYEDPQDTCLCNYSHLRYGVSWREYYLSTIHTGDGCGACRVLNKEESFKLMLENFDPHWINRYGRSPKITKARTGPTPASVEWKQTKREWLEQQGKEIHDQI